MKDIKEDKNDNKKKEAEKKYTEQAEAESEMKEKEKSSSKATKKRQGKKESELEKKLNEGSEKISKLENEVQTLKDQLLRKIAEFENYKRRTEKEFVDHLDYANNELILDILPVIDDFERSLDHMDDSKETEGIRLIYKKLFSTLEKKGLEVIEAVGQEFDPEQHQALMQVDSEDAESGQIVEEHLKGYKLKDKVIRHSQVLVAK